ncbi:ParB family protein [Vibrio vulnificus]|uniref:ParB family protein n=1 Tax=Vibrio vulnificus TaxID=672 RepID=UPI003BF7F899
MFLTLFWFFLKGKSKLKCLPLAQFNSKGVFARKRVKGRNFSYEFGRLSKDVQSELDQAIAAVLEKYQGS